MSHKPNQMKKDQEYRNLLEDQLRLRDRVFTAQSKVQLALAELHAALEALSISDKKVLEVYSSQESAEVDPGPGITDEMRECYQTPPVRKVSKNPPQQVLFPSFPAKWVSNKIRYPIAAQRVLFAKQESAQIVDDDDIKWLEDTNY